MAFRIKLKYHWMQYWILHSLILRFFARYYNIGMPWIWNVVLTDWVCFWDVHSQIFQWVLKTKKHFPTQWFSTVLILHLEDTTILAMKMNKERRTCIDDENCGLIVHAFLKTLEKRLRGKRERSWPFHLDSVTPVTSVTTRRFRGPGSLLPLALPSRNTLLFRVALSTTRE